MSLTAVLKEISSVANFFASRDDTGACVAGLHKSFADSVCNKLKQLKCFGVSEGAQIHEALKGEQFGRV